MHAPWLVRLHAYDHSPVSAGIIISVASNLVRLNTRPIGPKSVAPTSTLVKSRMAYTGLCAASSAVFGKGTALGMAPVAWRVGGAPSTGAVPVKASHPMSATSNVDADHSQSTIVCGGTNVRLGVPGMASTPRSQRLSSCGRKKTGVRGAPASSGGDHPQSDAGHGCVAPRSSSLQIARLCTWSAAPPRKSQISYFEATSTLICVLSHTLRHH